MLFKTIFQFFLKESKMVLLHIVISLICLIEICIEPKKPNIRFKWVKQTQLEKLNELLKPLKTLFRTQWSKNLYFKTLFNFQRLINLAHLKKSNSNFTEQILLWSDFRKEWPQKPSFQYFIQVFRESQIGSFKGKKWGQILGPNGDGSKIKFRVTKKTIWISTLSYFTSWINFVHLKESNFDFGA